MKQRRVFRGMAAVWIVVLFLLPIVVLCAIGFSASRFGDTYYGELAPMWKKLKTAEGPKIVIVGNSAVAFGVDSALLQEELEADGFDYTVCNFGLYGAIGTQPLLPVHPGGRTPHWLCVIKTWKIRPSAPSLYAHASGEAPSKPRRTQRSGHCQG